MSKGLNSSLGKAGMKWIDFDSVSQQLIQLKILQSLSSMTTRDLMETLLALQSVYYSASESNKVSFFHKLLKATENHMVFMQSHEFIQVICLISRFEVSWNMLTPGIQE